MSRARVSPEHRRLTDSQTHARLMAFKRANGICRQCPSLVVPGRSVCAKHLEKNRKKAATYLPRWRQLHLDSGMCVYCSSAAIAGRSSCAMCLERMKQYAKEYFVSKRRDGLCGICTQRAERGCSRCARHLSAIRSSGNGGRSFSSDLLYPYFDTNVKRDPEPGVELLLAINQVVPKGLTEWLRTEVCQDIALAVIEGSIEQSDIAVHVSRFIKAAQKRFPVYFAPISLEYIREVRGDVL